MEGDQTGQELLEESLRVLDPAVTGLEVEFKRYDPQLIDATYALLLATHGEALVIPTLNRDGDCLSDMVLQMFGSIAGTESLLIALDEDENPETVMAEAPHGTAPSLEGKNVANPMAMTRPGAGRSPTAVSGASRRRPWPSSHLPGSLGGCGCSRSGRCSWTSCQ